MPRFPTGICDRTFELARKYLDDLQYGNGPVALSCDDTKLHAAWRTYYDSEKDTHYLVGGTDAAPMPVANVDELNAIIRGASAHQKATKVLFKVSLTCTKSHLADLATVQSFACGVYNQRFPKSRLSSSRPWPSRITSRLRIFSFIS